MAETVVNGEGTVGGADHGAVEVSESATPPRSRRPSTHRLRRMDSLNLEAGKVSGGGGHVNKDSWNTTLLLAFQSIGVIYGDIGTSPLYVYSSTFTDGIKNTDDILGVLSLILYTIILIPMIKYVFIVLHANDNGDGGTFALYSLICRYARIGLIPNEQAEDAALSNYLLETPSNNMWRAAWVKRKLEGSKVAKIMLFLVTILGTSMVMGDGVLTPCISVLSAVGGIQKAASSLHQDAIVGISVAILILLFMVQRLGTDKVGYCFAPVVFVWFLFIGGIGVYNLFKHELGVLKAFNPKYIVDYFKRNGKQGWISLGGVVLCITGTEAMFADLGHFNVRAVQISFSGLLFPAVSLAYIGQAAYLTKYPGHVGDTFYKSIPGPLYWPTFVVAVATAIIASQAMISGAFAIISQSLTLGCFPRVKIVHTSTKYEGQVYIPEINYILMVSCVVVTVAFRTTEKIGNAYGIAVVTVMIITTFYLSLIMMVIWKTNLWLIVAFLVVFGAVETLYLSSALYKFSDGGFLPLLVALVLMGMMGVWHYAHVKRYEFELKNKVSSTYVRDLVQQNNHFQRLPGVGLLYSELVQGIPPIFPHFVQNIPSIHQVLVFVSIKLFPIGKVAPEERFLFRQVEDKEFRVFRCVVRYGYNDVQQPPQEFERALIDNLKDYIHRESIGQLLDDQKGDAQQENSKHKMSTVHTEETLVLQQEPPNSSGSRNSIIETPFVSETSWEEVEFLEKAMNKGVFYLIGEAEVIAAKESSFLKKVTIDYLYSFLRKNFRQAEKVMLIPRDRLLRVGMTYEI